MDEMEEKLGSILNNPQMMQQIMALAQSLNQSQPSAPASASAPAPAPAPRQEPQPQRQESPANPLPNLDLSAIGKLSGLARQSGVDQQQQALLKALSPYLSRDRVVKLEKAMRAAKLAKLASAFLNAGGLQILSGR